MPLQSMKMTKEDRKMETPAMLSEKPEYPYGLCLRLDNATMKKLGMSSLPDVGSILMISAKAEVVSVSERDSAYGGEDRNCELQITEMNIEGASNDKAAKSLYGDKE